MKTKIKVGIAGGAGYTGGELLRLLLPHPQVEVFWVLSKSQAGQAVSEIHTDLIGDTELRFSGEPGAEPDLLILCLGHGEAAKFLKQYPPSAATRVIDLSQDHRTGNGLSEQEWVYGLPELHRSRIIRASRIANPGCFATAIQLSLLPLAAGGLLTADIHVSATTGSTGAGQSLSATSHFSWRQNNLSVYKAFRHQHLAEIGQSLELAQPGFRQALHFIPQRGSFTRGILSTLYTRSTMNLPEAFALYEAHYAQHPFVHVSRSEIDLKQVLNTNKCILHLKMEDDQLLVTAILDNLLKGASGQAVQNMNLMFDLAETTGLRLKASAF